MDGPPVLLVGLILGVVAAFVTARWARMIWQRRKELALWRKMLALFAVMVALCSALGIVLGLVKAFGAVGGEAVDPSQKARILAERISEAMNLALLGLLVWLPSTIALVFLMSKPRAERPRE